MKKTNLVKTVSLLSVALFLGGTGLSTDASAKAVKTKSFHVTKITKTTHYKKSTFKKAHAKKGVTIYTNRYLTKHNTSKKTHVFYSTQKVRVHKSNGKTASYRYVTNKKGTVKGWIWAGRLSGKQGKVTKVSKKTVQAPTTNSSVARKTTVTTLKQTSNVKPAKTDNAKIHVISDRVSNSSYYGVKNVATLRDKINKFGWILKNHPNAWDAYGNKYHMNHERIYSQVSDEYNDDYQTYLNVIKNKDSVSQEQVNEMIKDINEWLNCAKY